MFNDSILHSTHYTYANSQLIPKDKILFKFPITESSMLVANWSKHNFANIYRSGLSYIYHCFSEKTLDRERVLHFCNPPSTSYDFSICHQRSKLLLWHYPFYPFFNISCTSTSMFKSIKFRLCAIFSSQK